MKKVIIAISLVLIGALLITPITNAVSSDDSKEVNNQKLNIEQNVENNDKTTQTNNIDKSKTEEMSKSEAEEILNKYIKDVEKADFTYTYQGDENTFEVIKEKGIRGYVFLPNIETDMAYLVDKDNGSIYHFHPSGYLEKLQ